MASFDAYTSREGFDLVIGYLHGEPIGQSWGWAPHRTPPGGGGCSPSPFGMVAGTVNS
jgi:hypothetical protein